MDGAENQLEDDRFWGIRLRELVDGSVILEFELSDRMVVEGEKDCAGYVVARRTNACGDGEDIADPLHVTEYSWFGFCLSMILEELQNSST